MYLHSKKSISKYYFHLIIFISLFCSCHLFDDRLDRFPPDKDLVGKFYWALSKKYSTSDTLGTPKIWDEIYFDISEFDERSGTFNVDTYVNNQIVRHQVIVNSTSYTDFYYPQYSTINYIDQDRQNNYYFTDGNENVHFDVDNPSYIITSSYPIGGYSVRNYFVKYTWGQ